MGHKTEAYAERTENNDSFESLMSSLNALNIKEGPTAEQPYVPQQPGYLPVRLTPGKVKEYDFVEVKTLAQRKSVDWEVFYPQLYLSKTTSIHLALHARGQFVTIEKYGTEDLSLAKYKTSVEKSLGKLLEFLRRLLVTLRASGDGPWALMCIDGGLKLYKSDEGCLPDAILSKFNA